MKTMFYLFLFIIAIAYSIADGFAFDDLLMWSFIIIFTLYNLGKPSEESDDEPDEPTHKQCPYCAEVVLIEAIKCKHCHSELQ